MPGRLLADAAHEEDVVIDPERHQKDEAEERHSRIRTRETSDAVEDECRDPEGGTEREHGAQDEEHGRDDRAQEQHQDDEDHAQHQRDDQIAVMDRRVVRVDRGRRHSAHHGAGHHALQFTAKPTNRVDGRLGVGGVGQGALQEHLAANDRGFRGRRAGRSKRHDAVRGHWSRAAG